MTPIMNRAGNRGAGRARQLLSVTGLLVVAGVVLAACSSSSSTSSLPQSRASSTPASSSAPTTPPSSSATVKSATSAKLGTYLVDSAGYALYMLSSDPANTSTCTSGACTAVWPPLTTSGTPTAGGGVSNAELGTITRSGGGTQVTYNHHPLYTFTHDTAPGQTNGEGIKAFGGTWTLVNLAGLPIAPVASGSGTSKTSSAGASSSSTSSGSSGGYTY